MYRPLPNFLTIQKSDIEGLGLYAIKDIPSGTDLGLTHIKLGEEMIIRTPLGGFYNHSDDPNCEKYFNHLEWTRTYLRTCKDIKNGEEITASYTLYQIST
jgi:SET domain-containing protein|tara:strand:+ start:156 stop:455 length:300 start_codon:yes stop_codon:yes gene_type:complete